MVYFFRVWLAVVVFTCSLIASAAVKESPINQYADNLAIPAGSSISILVSKKANKIVAVDANQNESEVIDIKPWATYGEIAKGSTQVLEQLKTSLDALGFDVKIISQPDSVAAGDLLINASLLLRTAKLSGKSARWDGVKAKKKSSKSNGSYGWTGTTKGVSLRLVAYDASGQWLFNSYGGVALPFYSDMKAVENKIKPDVYDNKKNISDGVNAALLVFKKHLVEAGQQAELSSDQVGLVVRYKKAAKTYLNSRYQQCNYKRYLEQADSKAFFITARGAIAWVAGMEDSMQAIKQARNTCAEQASIDECRLFDIDGEMQLPAAKLALDTACD